MKISPSAIKIGVLGGGQLGKMMAQEAARLDLNLHFLDQSSDFPAGKVSPWFKEGDFNSYSDVMEFGSDLDYITIEIEHVNCEALKELEQKGIKVYPQARIIELINDKASQKAFYIEHGFPTAPFFLFERQGDIRISLSNGNLQFPFVQKLRRGGYDGRGVQIAKHQSDLDLLLDGPCIVEQLADIDKELSVIAVRSATGECKVYPAVSMVFHPTANLVETLCCPAEIPEAIEDKARQLAFEIANKLGIVGLLAVEFFYNKNGELWVNEMAPRPHNSGHHTLNNGAVSQFENHLRAILGWPLGDTQNQLASVMLNLLGADTYSGKAVYDGLDKALSAPGVFLHLYGKEITKPLRKMGHINIVGSNQENCKSIAKQLSNQIQIIA